MKVVIAIDSFKGSISSIEAGNAAKEGVKRVFKDAQVEVFPIADGGEGTVDALTCGLGGEIRYARVINSVGEKRDAKYGVVGNTAIIEAAEAVGIALLNKGQLNPLYTTSYGIGQMINDAIDKGCRNFIIGLGGSATNDGGVGMLQALGYAFRDGNLMDVPFGAIGLKNLAYINNTKANDNEVLKKCTFHVACDVPNPLCGENGCTNVFARQKGAIEEDIEPMDSWLRHYALLTNALFEDSNDEIPGSGAAGGLGFAFASYLNAELKSGIDLVLEQIKLDEALRDADIVITGEGRIDAQTVMGKAPIGVAQLAKKYAKPVIAFCGATGKDLKACNDCGIDGIFPIVRGACSLEDAMNNENAKNNMTSAVEQVMRIIKARI